MSSLPINSLKQEVNNTIIQNDNHEITGDILNRVLIDIIDSLINGNNINDDSITESKLGVQLKNKINSLLAEQGYFRNSQAGSVINKSITTGFGYIPRGGGSIKIKFEQKNTVNNVTLNIDSTGEKPLYYNGQRASSTNTWYAGETVEVFLDTNADIYQAKTWLISPVSVSKNTTTGEITIKIGNDTITFNSLIDNAVTSNKIADDAVTSNKIADDAVTSNKIADNAVTSNKIADDAVTSNKIADDAVTSNKIADNAVTSDKIANDAVTKEKLGQDVKTELKNITGLDDPQTITHSASLSATMTVQITSYVQSNRKYAISLVKWDSTGLQSGMACGFRFVKDGQNTYVYNSYLASDYSGTVIEVTVPPAEDWTSFEALGRANDEIIFTIQDITNVKSLSELSNDINEIELRQDEQDIERNILKRGSSSEFVENVTLSKIALNPIIEDIIMDTVFDSAEAASLSTFLTLLQSRKSNGMFLINYITDTHVSEAFINKKESAIRGIRMFNKFDALCDVNVHGGDLISESLTTRDATIGDLRAVADMIRVTNDLLIAKGNHDYNGSSYRLIPFDEIDFANNTYYVRDGVNFNPVTFTTWKGQQLYVADNDKSQRVDSITWKNAIQKYMAPSTAVWGDGSYFYFDNDTEKLRIIVFDNYAWNGTTNDLAHEYKWLAEVALNLTAKATPSDWRVLLISHEKVHNNNTLVSIITAFINGTSVSNTGGSVTWSADFSVQGAGHFIANLHGHDHSRTYNDSDGFNDIGMPSALCQFERLGQPGYYGNTVISLDFDNEKIYCDQLGNTTREYNFYL